MDIVKTCPLGHVCERAVEGHVERCIWYMDWYQTGIDGKQTASKQCAVLCQAHLMSGLSEKMIGVQQAVESRGNETIKRQDAFLAMVNNRRQIR